MKRYDYHENGLHVVLEQNDRNEIKLLHFSALPFEEGRITSVDGTDGFRLVEIQMPGLDRPEERFGNGYTSTAPGCTLRFAGFNESRTDKGKKLEIVTEDLQAGIRVVSHLQFFDGIPVVRSWTEVKNDSGKPRGLTYVSSFALAGIEKEGTLLPEEKLEVLIPHNAWQKELVFSRKRLSDCGMISTQPFPRRRSSQLISVSNTGSWSTKQYLPMGGLKNRETGNMLFWQIEHNGSWHWEIGEHKGQLYLQLSGPEELYGHWYKELAPGESFTSVPVAVGSVEGDIDEMGAALTRYRRAIRRKNQDNEELPVIFNDYMNCLFGDPTTEKELPMIEKAAEAGCKYYVIDAGWYSDGPWWDGVGEWLPSEKRFPGGLKELLARIREKGMVPGLWLELEVMGIHCPKAEKVPKEWFFLRHGERVYDRSRYQLDFRNPEVIHHADEVIDRLVGDYGAGYIKMDYNIEPGIGTEYQADSCGDGLLGHNRAYLAWLETVFERYPDLVIENCSSGGLRMDYAMLSRCSIQSTSDLEDYLMYATVAANAPMAVTPEQAAVWSYPLETGDEEETIFNMVSALLLRIHQSGHLVRLNSARFELVKEAIGVYKDIRSDIKRAVPFWPLGLSSYHDRHACLGLRTEETVYLAVWQRGGDKEELTLPVPSPGAAGKAKVAEVIYPKGREIPLFWQEDEGLLRIRLPEGNSARLIRIR